MTAYYNEFDPFAAQWLRNMIDAGHLRDFAAYACENLGGTSGAHIRQRLYFIGMADGERAGLERLAGDGDDRDQPGRDAAGADRPVTAPSPTNGTGAPAVKRGDVDWLFSRDGRWRPVEPGTFPLANAVAGRNGQLRAYGNGLDFETVVNFVAVVKELVE